MRILLCILILTLTGSANAVEKNPMHDYGDIIEYKQDKALNYPDFTITYKESRLDDSQTFKFRYEDFLVTTPESETTVSWTPGTGEISESRFTVGDKKFYLDLAPRENGKFVRRSITDPALLIVHDEKGYKAYKK